jgi:hypothetical protein
VSNPIELYLSRSRRLAALLALPFVLGLALLIWLAPPPWLLVPLALLNLAGLIHCPRQYALLQNPSAIKALHVDHDLVRVQCIDGSTHEVLPVPGSLLTPWLSVVRFDAPTLPRTRFQVILCRWNCARLEQLRRLRVRLRFLPPT